MTAALSRSVFSRPGVLTLIERCRRYSSADGGDGHGALPYVDWAYVFVAALGLGWYSRPDRPVMTDAPEVTAPSTKPQSDSALRSGTTASQDTSGVATALPLSRAWFPACAVALQRRWRQEACGERPGPCRACGRRPRFRRLRHGRRPRCRCGPDPAEPYQRAACGGSKGGL